MKIFGWIVAVIIALCALMAISVGLHLISVPAALVVKSTDPDTMISNYEEFQEIYNTCQKINTDLGSIRDVPPTDPMFEQFSKQALITAKRQQMARWVEEYNAKSRMLNRKYWKSRDLPYQLSVDEFQNYRSGQ